MMARLHGRPLRALSVLLLAAGLAGPAFAAAEATLVMVLLRALTYDRNKTVSVEGELVFGVAFTPDAAASLRAHRQLTDALSDKKLEYNGKPVRVVSVAIGAGTDPAAAMEGKGLSVLFITDGLDEQVPALLEACTSAEVVPVTFGADRVRAGVPLGVELRDGRPKPIINLKAARARKLDFSAALLQLAQVVE